MSLLRRFVSGVSAFTKAAAKLSGRADPAPVESTPAPPLRPTAMAMPARPLPLATSTLTSGAAEQVGAEATLLFTWAVRNVKTGRVLTAFVGPTLREAVATCEGCSLLDGRCYAHRSGQRAGAENVYINAAEDPAHYTLDGALSRWRERWPQVARFCGIGDPARVEREALLGGFAKLRGLGYSVLGYTHFWRDPANADLKGHLMASCDDLVEAEEALRQGWRPAVLLPAGFEGRTLVTPGGSKGVVCPEETGRAKNCATCRLCDVDHAMWARGRVQMIGFVEHGRHAQRASVRPSSESPPSDPPVTPAPTTLPVAGEARRWLVEPYLPANEVTLLTGGRRTGKGLFCAALAASASLGRRLAWDLAHEEPLAQHLVTWATPEVSEDHADEISARVLAAGGDPTRFQTLRVAPERDAVEVLRRHLRLRGEKPKLLILDPLQAVVGDLAQPTARSRMESLVGLARDTSTTVLAIRHVLKDGSQGRGRGEIADVARSELVVGKHPNDAGLVVLAQAPSSYGEGEPVAFSIGQADAGPRLFHVTSEWDDDIEVVDLLPRPPRRRPTSRSPRLDRAVRLVEELLLDGPRLRTEVVLIGRRRRLSESTIDRAADRLGVLKEIPRAAGRFAEAIWRLGASPARVTGGDDHGRDHAA